MSGLFVILWCASEPSRWWECNSRRILFDDDDDIGEDTYIVLKVKRHL